MASQPGQGPIRPGSAHQKVKNVGFHYARCPDACPDVPLSGATWTCPKNGRSGRVHVSHAAAEASYYRERSLAL